MASIRRLGDRPTAAYARNLCPRAGKRRLAEQVLGSAADMVRLDGCSKFETHSRRLGDLGGPAERVSHHLAVADRSVMLGIGQGSGQRGPLALQLEHSRFVTHGS